MATYYVRLDGSNGNFGTTDNAVGAWRNLSYACGHVVSGDTVIMRPGTFLETAQCNLPEGVNLQGSGIGVTIVKSTLTAQFAPLLALNSIAEGANGNQYVRGIEFDGQSLSTSVGITVTARGNVEIDNCKIINFKDIGVTFTGITSFNGDGEAGIYAADNKFHDNIVYNCAANDFVGPFKYGRACLQFGSQLRMLIYNNNIEQPYRTGTITSDIGWPVKYATGGFTKDCKVYNNIMKRALFTNATGHGIDEDWNFSFEMWNTQGLEFYNNTCQGEVDIVNATKGAYTYGLSFHHNISSYPAIRSYYQSGLRLETNESDHIIENNLFENQQSAITFSPKDYQNNGFGIDVHRIVVRNNRMLNIGIVPGVGNYGDQQCICMNNFDNPITYFDYLTIVNNTIVAHPSNPCYIGILVPAYGGGACNNIYIDNNIIQGFSYKSIFVNPSANVDYLYVRNNSIYANADNTVSFSGATPAHYTNSGNLTTNPLFVGSGDYTLQIGSPAKNSGTDGTDRGYTGGGGGGGNIAPAANAGPNQTITLPTSSTVFAGSGTDSDGTIASHLWLFISGPNVPVITTPSSYTSTVTGLTVAGVYNFRLTTIDNEGATGSDDMLITVNAEDIPSDGLEVSPLLSVE